MSDLVFTKRPYCLSSKTYKIKADGKKWYITISINSDKPFELFIITNDSENFDKNYVLRAVNKLLVQLEPYLNGKYEPFLEKLKKDNLLNRFSRLISFWFRAGFSVTHLVEILDELKAPVTSIVWQVSRLIKKEFLNGQSVYHVVFKDCHQPENCIVVFENGCHLCKFCGNSKC